MNFGLEGRTFCLALSALALLIFQFPGLRPRAFMTCAFGAAYARPPLSEVKRRNRANRRNRLSVICLAAMSSAPAQIQTDRCHFCRYNRFRGWEVKRLEPELLVCLSDTSRPRHCDSGIGYTSRHAKRTGRPPSLRFGAP